MSQIIDHLIDHRILLTYSKINTRYKSNLTQELIDLITLKTNFLKYDACISTRLYCIINQVESQPTCDSCDSILKMRLSGRFRGTFPTFCGTKCFSDTEQVKTKRSNALSKLSMQDRVTSSDKRKQTNLSRYGVDNVGKSLAFRAKAKQTFNSTYDELQQQDLIKKRKHDFILKYGVDNPSLVPEFKEKRKRTNIKRHGVSCVFSSSDIIQQSITTMNEKYGVDYALQSTDIHNKQRATMVERYGVEYTLQSDTLRDVVHSTMMQRYQVTHALQDPVLCSSKIKTCTNNMIRLFNRRNSNQIHYTDECWNQLNDRDWLHEQHYNNDLTLFAISKLLGVAHSTISLFFDYHNIVVRNITGSLFEREVHNFLRSILSSEVKILTNDRSIISPLELDIVIPELNIAFELNGIYWHSEGNGKNSQYHLNKTTASKDNNFRLIHINEHEWVHKTEIVQSRIASLLQLNDTTYARKTKVQSITKADAREFFDRNHIQGHVGGSYYYGLMIDDNIVAAMSFGHPRFNKSYQYELLRYCSTLNTNVIGGAGKLFKHFVIEHNPKSIISYSDKRWNVGTVYEKIGFEYSHTSAPNYHYFHSSNNLILRHRMQFQKHKQSEILPIFDSKLTEYENMLNNGYDRIWDCGNDVWCWDNFSVEDRVVPMV